MNNPNGPYPGRQIFIGMTAGGKPAFLYLVTGRSPASRERKATPRGDSIIMGPISDVPYDWLRHYMAVKVDNSIGLMAVSNGIQTEAIFEMYKLLYHTNHQPNDSFIKKTMDGADYEADSIKTPRISGIIMNPPGKTEPVYYVSIVTNGQPATVWEVKPKAGMFYGVSTYKGDMEKPSPFNIASGLSELKVAATGPQEITSYLYEISAEDYQGDDIRVCAIGGVREGMVWKTALINRHEGTGCRIVGVG
jgi:IMP cyclohydrolase